MKKETSNFVPNIIVWSWMRTVLNLCGAELMIFSYIFSESFDSVHRCYTSLTDMESWFGITRQTISRNIDRLCEKAFIYKETNQDPITPIIKHNNYRVNMKTVTKLCENADYTSYKNFLDSYSYILKNVFPQSSVDIDKYLSNLLQWHETKNIKVCITLNEIATLLQTDEVDTSLNLNDLLSSLSSLESCKNTPKQDETPKAQKLFNTDSKVRRKTLKNEWQVSKKEMNSEFVFLKASGNTQLLELLNGFLETTNGKNYNPTQWQQQLDNLYKYGRTVDRMIEGVRTSFMNNYRSLYLVDKSEVDMDKKLLEISNYVKQYDPNNEGLKKWLDLYVTEVPKGKSSTLNQFKLMLDNLTNICKTTEDKINSVKLSYTNSYSALAYVSASKNSDTDTCVDMDAKEVIIVNFITQGYYQLCDGLEQSLYEYIHETSSGRSMTATSFTNALDNLRLFCLEDTDKVSKVKAAIQNNSNKLATEDFEETRKLKARFETRQSMADSFDRSRKARVEMQKRKNPNDPRLKNIVVTSKGHNFI